MPWFTLYAVQGLSARTNIGTGIFSAFVGPPLSSTTPVANPNVKRGARRAFVYQFLRVRGIGSSKLGMSAQKKPVSICRRTLRTKDLDAGVYFVLSISV